MTEHRIRKRIVPEDAFHEATRPDQLMATGGIESDRPTVHVSNDFQSRSRKSSDTPQIKCDSFGFRGGRDERSYGMDRPFNDDDREKRVVTSDGRTIGKVRDVDDDRARVDRSDDEESLTEEIKDMLGWSDEDEAHELRRDKIDRDEDDKLYLQPRR